MRFSIQKELFDALPDLTIGMVVATGLDNSHPSKEIDALLSQTIEEMKKNFIVEKAQDHPRIKPWRNAFSKLAISGSKFPSSIESMARRVLKGDPFPKINPLVDLYNSVSLKYLVPMGGHDLDTLEGNIHLRFAEGWEPFTPMGGGETTVVPKGELIYRDDREVLPGIGCGVDVKKIKPLRRQKTSSSPSMSSGRWEEKGQKRLSRSFKP